MAGVGETLGSPWLPLAIRLWFEEKVGKVNGGDGFVLLRKGIHQAPLLYPSNPWSLNMAIFVLCQYYNILFGEREKKI
jgi:hypothetical protein